MMMDEKLKMEEMDLVSGGMATHEWENYNKHYDKAMIRAQMAGDKDLLAKLTKERIILEAVMTWHGLTLYKDSGGNYSETKPYAKWKLEDMPNVELVYKMGGRKAS